VPAPYLDEAKLRKVFSPAVKRIWITGDSTEIDELVEKRDKIAYRLESAEVKLIKLANGERLKAMKKGDRALFYHTGEQRAAVGIVEVIREAYPDPTDKEGVFVAVDVKAGKPLKKPVTLASVKADKRLKDMVLAKQPRLSVQPVTAEEWKIVCGLGGV